MIEDIFSVDNLSDEENKVLTDALEANTDEFTTLKFIEELAELQEKLIKYHLKSKDHKPKIKEVLDEVSDVIMRSLLFVDRVEKNDPEFDVTEYLSKRLDKKLTKMYGYAKEGKYQGGL